MLCCADCSVCREQSELGLSTHTPMTASLRRVPTWDVAKDICWILMDSEASLASKLQRAIERSHSTSPPHLPPEETIAEGLVTCSQP